MRTIGGHFGSGRHVWAITMDDFTVIFKVSPIPSLSMWVKLMFVRFCTATPLSTELLQLQSNSLFSTATFECSSQAADDPFSTARMLEVSRSVSVSSCLSLIPSQSGSPCSAPANLSITSGVSTPIRRAVPVSTHRCSSGSRHSST